MAGAPLPGGSVEALRAMVSAARGNVSTIRHGLNPTTNRGPRASRLRLRYYLLPEGSPVPVITGNKDAALIDAHHQCRYGFPNGKNTMNSCDLGLSEEDYNAFVRSLYPNLAEGTRFILYKCNRRKSLAQVNGHDTLHKYAGVVFLKVANENPDTPDEQPDVVLVEPGSPTRQAPLPNSPNTPDTPDDQPDVVLVVPANLTRPALMQGTLQPEVDASRRRRIILDQDIEYAASIRVDRERTRDREAAARLQDRRRQQQQARQASIERTRREQLDALGEEPEDGVTLSFRCAEANLQRRFRVDEECQRVYVYVTSSLGQDCRLLGPDGLLPNNASPISDFGMRQNSTLNVEILEESEDETDLVLHIEESDEEEVPAPDLYEALQERRERARANLLPHKQVQVRRDSLVEDLIDVYRADKDLHHHNINMEIVGEPAVDVDGVKREVFCLFFTLVMSLHFSGEDERIPRMDPRLVCDGFFTVIGRILAHAFVLVGFFPVALSKATFMTAAVKGCSESVLLQSLIKVCSERVRGTLQKVLSGAPLTEVEKLTLFGFLADSGMCHTPEPAGYREAVVMSAEMTLIYRPLAALTQLWKGMSGAYYNLWGNLNETAIQTMYTRMTPTPDYVVSSIHYEFSDDPGFRAAEERIKQYLETFIEDRICTELLPQLLRYWTASSTLIVPRLTVSFNSLEGVARRPFVNACVAQLNLSRMYVGLEDFINEFMIYLNSEGATVFDSY